MITKIRNIFWLLLISSLFSSSISVINIWHQMLYENRKLLREVCDQYEKNNPGIKINLTYRVSEELRSSYQAAAMGGSGPELIYGPSDQVGPFSIMNIIQPLDHLFTKNYFNQYNIAFKNIAKYFENQMNEEKEHAELFQNYLIFDSPNFC